MNIGKLGYGSIRDMRQEATPRKRLKEIYKAKTPPYILSLTVCNMHAFHM